MPFTRQLASVVAVAVFSSAQADIINVGPGDSIQDAIDAAMNGDEVVVAPGTYFETINFLGKAITVRSSDGPEVTIIDATGLDQVSVVKCVTGEGLDTVLDSFTVTGAAVNFAGGGMYNSNSSPTVTNCTFVDNLVFCVGNPCDAQGAGMYNENSSPTVTNCTFRANAAISFNDTGGGMSNLIHLTNGGGMSNFGGSPTVTNCTFEGNSASSGGGGMYNQSSSPTVTNCTFSGNSAHVGGAIYIGVGSPVLLDCTFRGNDADFGGGAIYNTSGSPMFTNCFFGENSTFTGGGGAFYNGSGDATIVNCTFEGNHGMGFLSTAAEGGAVYNDSGSPTLTGCAFIDNHVGSASFGGGSGGAMYISDGDPLVTNCLFSGNWASGEHTQSNGGQGGGIYNGNGGPTIISCTFSGNEAIGEFAAGGGVYNPFVGLSPAFVNCVLWGNRVNNGTDEAAQIDASGQADVDYCCVQGLSGALGGTGNIGTDPLFVGGPSGTWTAAAIYDDQTDQTTFTDDKAGLVPGAVVGKLINHNTGWFVPLHRIIIANTTSTMTVRGQRNALAGASYEVLDYDLGPGSPVIDAGDNTAVPEDIDTDLDGNHRFIDDPDTPDTGNGEPPIVDMGAYEFQGNLCPWDLDGDGNVFVVDLLLLLMDFGSCDGSPADFDGDGCVTVVDLLTLLFNFGPCPDGGCPWDVNGDGTVDATDLWQVLGNFGPCDGCPEDVNGDGVVNGQDAAAVATHFGPCP